ncbi:hypothetical protein HYW54_00495 [Candidatus Gottesmanbacteria bacterium]|nr:hypothetical protein [Candidatus Gottesmanbacteria bacterium]
MPGLKYQYSLLPGFEKSGLLAPLIPLTFKHGNKEFSTFALIDSGAERGLISTVIADALGIDWRKISKEIGLTTSGHFIFHHIRNIDVKIEEYEFRIDINVVEGINAFKCILGRRDIFQKCKITFEGYKKEFQLDFRNLN